MYFMFFLETMKSASSAFFSTPTTHVPTKRGLLDVVEEGFYPLRLHGSGRVLLSHQR